MQNKLPWVADDDGTVGAEVAGIVCQAESSRRLILRVVQVGMNGVSSDEGVMMSVRKANE